MNRQTLIEQRIYRLHERIAQALRDKPQETLEIARSNLKRYRKKNGDWPSYLEWEQKLALPVKDIIDILASHEESAVLARSNSPFAGVIPPRERWAILREFDTAHETPSN